MDNDECKDQVTIDIDDNDVNEVSMLMRELKIMMIVSCVPKTLDGVISVYN